MGIITTQEAKNLQTCSSRTISILPMESSIPSHHLLTWAKPSPVLVASELSAPATGWAHLTRLPHCCAQGALGDTQCILGTVSLAWHCGQHEL